MKLGANQLFTIALLASLAGLSFWLERIVAPVETRQDGKLRHDPDSIAGPVRLRPDRRNLVGWPIAHPAWRSRKRRDSKSGKSM